MRAPSVGGADDGCIYVYARHIYARPPSIQTDCALLNVIAERILPMVDLRRIRSEIEVVY